MVTVVLTVVIPKQAALRLCPLLYSESLQNHISPGFQGVLISKQMFAYLHGNIFCGLSLPVGFWCGFWVCHFLPFHHYLNLNFSIIYFLFTFHLILKSWVQMIICSFGHDLTQAGCRIASTSIRTWDENDGYANDDQLNKWCHGEVQGAHTSEQFLPVSGWQRWEPSTRQGMLLSWVTLNQSQGSGSVVSDS